MLKLNKKISFGRVGNETMLCNEENNKAARLDEFGTRIWQMIFEGTDEETIYKKFIDLYPKQKSAVISDIKDFIDMLIEYGFIYRE